MQYDLPSRGSVIDSGFSTRFVIALIFVVLSCSSARKEVPGHKIQNGSMQQMFLLYLYNITKHTYANYIKR